MQPKEKEEVIQARVEFIVLPDRKHVQMLFHFDGAPPAVLEWLRFAYCQDLKWTVHAMSGDASDVWMSMLNLRPKQ